MTKSLPLHDRRSGTLPYSVTEKHVTLHKMGLQRRGKMRKPCIEKTLILIFLAFTATPFFPATALSVDDQETRIIRMEEQVQGLKEQIIEIRKDVKSQLQGQNGNHVAVKELLSEVRHVSAEIKALEAQFKQKADLKDFQYSKDLNKAYETKLDQTKEILNTKINFFIKIPAIFLSILGALGIGWAVNAISRITGKWEKGLKETKEEIKQLQTTTIVNSLITEGNKFHSDEKYTQAIESYDAAIQLDPKNFYVWYNKGMSLAELKEFDEAIEAYNTAIEIDPNSPSAWINKGISFSLQKKHEEAIKAYDEAIKINKYEFSAWVNKGASFAELKRYNEAIEAYDKAIVINPNESELWNNKGASLSDKGMYEEAINAFDTAINLTPNNFNAWRNKGNTFFRMGRYTEAIESFNNAIELNHTNSPIWNSMGIAFAKLGKISHATNSYLSAINFNKNDILPYLNLIELQIINKKYMSANQAMKKALKINALKNEVIVFYLLAILQTIAGVDTSETEHSIDELLIIKPQINWTFNEIEEWLRTADLPETTKQYIENLTARVKERCITEE